MSATGKQPNAFWQYLISSSHLIMNILLKQLFITNCNELICLVVSGHCTPAVVSYRIVSFAGQSCSGLVRRGEIVPSHAGQDGAASAALRGRPSAPRGVPVGRRPLRSSARHHSRRRRPVPARSDSLNSKPVLFFFLERCRLDFEQYHTTSE